MTALISDVIASYLENLTATNEICDALGTTLTENSNLFNGYERKQATDCLSLITYPGGAPNRDKYRQNPSIQIRIKTSNRSTAMKVGQACINVLHMNTIAGNCLMQAINSAPFVFQVQEGGEKVVSTVSFDLKHVKV